jgi:ketosteroid isomerase-like protein
MLKDLAKDYVDAFGGKDIGRVAQLLDEGFILEDPVVTRVEGKKPALDVIQGIFDSCETLLFLDRNIFEEGSVTIIEFDLTLDDTVIQGVDIILWKDNKMQELRAYLDTPCEERT